VLLQASQRDLSPVAAAFPGFDARRYLPPAVDALAEGCAPDGAAAAAAGSGAATPSGGASGRAAQRAAYRSLLALSPAADAGLDRMALVLVQAALGGAEAGGGGVADVGAPARALVALFAHVGLAACLLARCCGEEPGLQLYVSRTAAMSANVPRVDPALSLPVATYASALGAAVSSTVLFAVRPGARAAVAFAGGATAREAVIPEHIQMIV